MGVKKREYNKLQNELNVLSVRKYKILHNERILPQVYNNINLAHHETPTDITNEQKPKEEVPNPEKTEEVHGEKHNESHDSTKENPHNEAHGAHEEHSKHKEHHEHHIPSEGLVVWFTFGCLMLGCFCRILKNITGIPYTPQLMVLGVLLGGFSDSLGDFGRSIDIVLQIDPHGILMIFIPTILFESAFNADSYVFKKEIWQCLI